MIFIFSSKKDTDECDRRMKHFAAQHKDFVQCALKHGQPVEICTNCLEQYTESTFAYKNLTTEINGTNCKEHFVDADRLNIVETMYLQGVDLWNRAFCKRNTFFWFLLEKLCLTNHFFFLVF